jgi:hypothetical protein
MGDASRVLQRCACVCVCVVLCEVLESNFSLVLRRC